MSSTTKADPAAGPTRSGAPFAIKAEVGDPAAAVFAFDAQKTMYGGKQIARGIVTAAAPTPRKPGIERQTPRVSVTIRRTARAVRRLGRQELKPFTNWNDERPETELNFKFYRQATNKVVGLSDRAAAFLHGFF